jgi:hypothetical protein
MIMLGPKKQRDERERGRERHGGERDVEEGERREEEVKGGERRRGKRGGEERRREETSENHMETNRDKSGIRLLNNNSGGWQIRSNSLESLKEFFSSLEFSVWPNCQE